MEYISNCDWLSFSVLLAQTSKEKDEHTFTLSCPSGFKLVNFPGTNIYKYRSILYNDAGEKMLTILYQPHSHVIEYRSALVEVANKWLYCGFEWVLDTLYNVHPFTFSNISRIDIAADFVAKDDTKAIIRGLANNTIYVANKAEGSLFFETETPERGKINREPKCISWGSKNSNIKWKLYNKSKEICVFDTDGNLVSCEKPYILAQWEQNEWDIHHVWRLEVSITSAYKFQYQDRNITIDDTQNIFYLDAIFRALYTTRFIQRRNQGHKDKTNDERVWLIDIESRERLRTKVGEEAKESVAFISTINALMKQRATTESQANGLVYNSLTRTIIEIVHAASLEGYFNKVYGYPVEEIDKLKNNNIQVPEKVSRVLPKRLRFYKYSRNYKFRVRLRKLAEKQNEADKIALSLLSSTTSKTHIDFWWTEM